MTENIHSDWPGYSFAGRRDCSAVPLSLCCRRHGVTLFTSPYFPPSTLTGLDLRNASHPHLPLQKVKKKGKEKRSCHALLISSVAYWWLGSLQAFGINILLQVPRVFRDINFCDMERCIFTTPRSILMIGNKEHCTSWYYDRLACQMHTFLFPRPQAVP